MLEATEKVAAFIHGLSEDGFLADEKPNTLWFAPWK